MHEQGPFLKASGPRSTGPHAVTEGATAPAKKQRKPHAVMEADRTTASSERSAVKQIEQARLYPYGTQPAGRHRRTAMEPGRMRWYPPLPACPPARDKFCIDHAEHKEPGSTIRRYIIWRNKHAADIRLRTVVTRVNVA
ncbi:hypothetical protein GCM10010280_59220 [Streptomyces pilosus]|uniref:Uncharacterized protein n=1 Tax=Streptomyces pilosus TaxID=28893 RepID=A0A918C2B8_9ACTN|nr:hypothetical protein GCM10010280_59220 [Streptomyces pilosus]